MDALPGCPKLLAVGAHPDDETFGLGALLTTYVESGTHVDVLCLTRGESTDDDAPDDLAEVRAAELHEAAAVLGVERVELLSYPNGGLASVPLDSLAAEVDAMLAGVGLVLTLDDNGVTAHPDHVRAAEAVLAACTAIPVLGWSVPDDVARALNFEFGTSYVGRPREEIDLVVAVDRVTQLRAIARHRSQAGARPVLERRLELLGDRESLRWLRRP